MKFGQGEHSTICKFTTDESDTYGPFNTLLNELLFQDQTYVRDPVRTEANDESYVVSQLHCKKYSCPLALQAHIKEMVAASNVRDCISNA